MATSCQPSYPLNSENASPPGTFKVYLSCWATAMPPKTASTKPNAAAETTRKPREGEEGLSNMAPSRCRRFGTIRIASYIRTAELLNKSLALLRLLTAGYGLSLPLATRTVTASIGGKADLTFEREEERNCPFPATRLPRKGGSSLLQSPRALRCTLGPRAQLSL